MNLLLSCRKKKNQKKKKIVSLNLSCKLENTPGALCWKETGRKATGTANMVDRCTLMREETEKAQMHSLSFTKDIIYYYQADAG